MGSVRDIEVRFGSVEDNILNRLGYREYTLTVGNYEVNPLPEVVQKPIQAFSDSQVRRFIDNLGGQGNPITFYKVTISREVPEANLREYVLWTLTRGSYVAECLPVEFTVSDSRYTVILGVLKQSSAT
jgi:hypothetical protein